jgi:hypothetical protein
MVDFGLLVISISSAYNAPRMYHHALVQAETAIYKPTLLSRL